jgi:hypothetical protein
MLDRREELALLPLEDEAAAEVLASVPEDTRAECWWLVLSDGTPVRGDHGAGVVVLAELRATRPLGVVLRRLRASLLVDAIDRIASRYRRRLGRLVPDGPAPRRYP